MFPVWSQDTQNIFHSFHTNPRSGLSSEDISKNKHQYGLNKIETEKQVSRWVLFVRQFKNPMVYSLVIAGAVAFFIGEVLNAVAILSIVILNAVIGYLQEMRAEEAISSLKNLTVPRARVLREGHISVVDSSDIVPGDVLVLEAGDYVVADARLIETHQLSINEAILTGESFPSVKQTEPVNENTDLADRTNMIYAGTAVNNGTGKAVVTGTGMKTELGDIA